MKNRKTPWHDLGQYFPPELFGVLFFLCIFYWGISSMVFSFRHPWATQTEILISFPKVITFGTVKYEDYRPREKSE